MGSDYGTSNSTGRRVSLKQAMHTSTPVSTSRFDQASGVMARTVRPILVFKLTF